MTYFDASEIQTAITSCSASTATADFVNACFADEDKTETIESDVYDLDAFVAYVDSWHRVDEDTDLNDLISEFQDAFAGTWSSEEEYVESGIDEGLFGEFDKDSLLFRYLDINALTRDLFISDMTSVPAPGGEVHVFYNH